jgi:hypothetical protein
METKTETTKNRFGINIKNFNIFTLLSILLIIIGLAHYIYWGIRYSVWSDIGIYSITIVLVLPGIIGLFLTLMDKKEEKEED